MNPTLSSRLRHHNQEAAYWRMHPPTPWRSSQALVEASPLDVDASFLLPGVPPPPPRSLTPEAQGQRAEDQRSDGGGQVEGISWLPLLVWALLVLIDATRALIELGTALAGIWRNQQPPARRRSRRAGGGMAMGWPASLAGVS